LLVGAVTLRYMSGLAAELFTLRLSLLVAATALVVFHAGLRQLAHWWLPTVLLLLCIPIPTVVLNSAAFPLQLQASAVGARLLELRSVPVRLEGNILHLPGQTLFVTEACSGLRSITALLALGVLIGGLWLRRPWSRLTLVAAAIPIAMAFNAFRVFLTGFAAYYLSPAMSQGVMHYTEGWAVFIVAFATLGLLAWILSRVERLAEGRRQ
jgi:exosortase